MTNFSFENPALSDNSYENSSIPGWTSDSASDGVQNFIGTNTYGNGATLNGTADGKQAAYINGNYIYQDVGAAAEHDLHADRRRGKSTSLRIDPPGFHCVINGTDISGTVLSSEQVGPLTTTGIFTDFTTSFKTGASVSGDLTIELAKTSSGGQIDFDNVRLDATIVPEPSSALALMSIVAMGIAVGCRRWWKARA